MNSTFTKKQWDICTDEDGSRDRTYEGQQQHTGISEEILLGALKEAKGDVAVAGEGARCDITVAVVPAISSDGVTLGKVCLIDIDNQRTVVIGETRTAREIVLGIARNMDMELTGKKILRPVYVRWQDRRYAVTPGCSFDTQTCTGGIGIE